MKYGSVNLAKVIPGKLKFLVLSQKEAFGGDIGPKGEVWSTYSKIGQHVTHYVFKAALNTSFHLKPSHMVSARLVSARSHATSVFLPPEVSGR